MRSCRKTPELPEPSLSLVESPSREEASETGRKSGKSARVGVAISLIQVYAFTITGPSIKLFQIFLDLLQLCEKSKCSGVVLGSVKVDGLGMRPDPTLTLRIPGRNGGVATR